MSGFEQTIVVGNVGRAPEMRSTQTGADVCGFSVAVTTRWTDRQTDEKREKTNWYSVSCWGKLAEVANQYVRKGSQIMVVGTVSARAWSDNSGEAKASLDLRADTFQLLGGRDGGNGNYGADEQEEAPPEDISSIPF